MEGYTKRTIVLFFGIASVLFVVVVASAFIFGIRMENRDMERESDIKRMVLALELHYADEGSYPVSQDPYAPSSIHEEHMPDTPMDPSGGHYMWLNNDTGSGAAPGCDGQNYCVWADMERSGYFVGSSEGVQELSTEPVSCPCTTRE